MATYPENRGTKLPNLAIVVNRIFQKPAALKKVKYDKLIEAGKTPDWILQKFILEVALMR